MSMPLAVTPATPAKRRSSPSLRLPCTGKTWYPMPLPGRHRDRRRESEMKETDERQLIAACQALDHDAQRRVYELTVDRVYRLVHRMVRNADDAFDLTQEIYVRVFTRINRFRADCSLTTWVYRIAVNEALAFMRRNRTEDRYLRFSGGSDLDPPVDASREDVRMDVQAALDQLVQEERTILLLRYDQGLDYRAIAQAVQCPEGTVASRLNRARQRLRAVLSKGHAAREENQPLAHPNDGKARFRLSGADTCAQQIPETSGGAHRAAADGGQQ